MPSDQSHIIHRLFWRFLNLVATVAFVAVIAAGVVQAQPAAPTAIYWVTSSSNTAITTCAGAANDCSLRGAVQVSQCFWRDDQLQHYGDAGHSLQPDHVDAQQHYHPRQRPGSYFPEDQRQLSGARDSGGLRQYQQPGDKCGQHACWKQSARHGYHWQSQHHQPEQSVRSGRRRCCTSPVPTIPSTAISSAWPRRTAWPWAICINTTNDQWGILLDSANNNTVSHNTSGCNGQDGVGLYGNSYNNTVTDNYLGVVNWGGRVPNARAGVGLWNGATVNTYRHSRPWQCHWQPIRMVSSSIAPIPRIIPWRGTPSASAARSTSAIPWTGSPSTEP